MVAAGQARLGHRLGSAATCYCHCMTVLVKKSCINF